MRFTEIKPNNVLCNGYGIFLYFHSYSKSRVNCRFIRFRRGVGTESFTFEYDTNGCFFEKSMMSDRPYNLRTLGTAQVKNETFFDAIKKLLRFN